MSRTDIDVEFIRILNYQFPKSWENGSPQVTPREEGICRLTMLVKLRSQIVSRATQGAQKSSRAEVVKLSED